MKRIFAIFFLTVLFQGVSNAACVGSKCIMKGILDDWKGENLDAVIDVWGYPDKQKNIAGKKLYFWEQGTYRVDGIIKSKRTTDYCTRIIETDDINTVIGAKWKGSRCPITNIRTKKWVNPNKTLK